MVDLIDRQQAIDVLHGYFDGMLETDTVCPADIYGLFECMPSVQPEIIRCKDCLIHGVCRFEQGLGLNGYCSQAKRRTNG